MIRKSIVFFEEIGASRERIVCAVHLHPGLDVEMAEAFWQEQTRLPKTQFRKTICALSRASSQKKGNIQLYGTCHVLMDSTRLCQKMHCWMDLALAARW